MYQFDGGLSYRTWLSEKFSAIRGRNPAFSLRSFALRLGVSPASLCQILSGKRVLTPKMAAKIADRLHLAETERQQFLQSVAFEKLRAYFPLSTTFSLPA